MKVNMQVVGCSISTRLPRDVVYLDGTSVTLSWDYILKEGNLRLFVPKSRMEDVVNALKSSGFKEEKLEFYKGERYSLSMKICNIWELHVRIYDDGFIDGHFEVSRDYLEHLWYYTIPSIYEVFEFYKNACNKLLIFDNSAKKWVKEVRTQYLIMLNPPRSLTAWQPIAVAVVVGVLSSIIAYYALSRLNKGENYVRRRGF
jgi:hypothetical protein